MKAIAPQGRHTMRVEDAALLTGQGCFSDDVFVEGMVAGVFVRSPHAHARITGIALDEALGQPGVLTVLTGADMAAAGVGSLSRPPPLAGRDGKPLVVPHRPVLAGERVVHIGEAVALVVAETEAAARDAADLVDVAYEPLPAITEAEAALEPGAAQIWPEAQGNLAIDWQGPGGEPEEAAEIERIFSTAETVISARITNQRIAGVPMETRGATAQYDAAADRITLHAPSQSSAAVKGQLCAIMGLEPEQLQVLSPDVGGAFGLKTPPHVEYAAIMVAAKKLGRPVHWMASRAEAFLSDHQARDNVSKASLAMDGQGRFLALKVDGVTNLGGYLVSSGALIATISVANCFPAMYDIPHVSVRIRLAFTNTVPTGAYRGAGRPEANYIMERLVDVAARRTGIDPVELRRRNLIPPESMPYRTPSGGIYDSGEFATVMDKALALADRKGFAARRAESEGRGRRRGFGISCFLEHAGGGPTEGAVLEVAGGTVTVRLGMQASGQGHATLFSSLVAERLGVPEAQVVVEQGTSELPIKGGPAVGSRTTNAAGKAVITGAAQLIEKARAVAAELWEAEPEQVEYGEDGYLDLPGTNQRLSLFELAGQVPEADALKTITQVDAVNTWPNGCHIAEVEIDPETGETALVSYVAVDDCGTVLDHTMATGQVVGGIVQGVGQALMEAVVYDPTGQLLTGSFMDYAMPRADDLPMFETTFHEVPCTTNPLGVKGLGEAGTTAALAAVMNAIADALPEGAGEGLDMPATPERVWRACLSSSRFVIQL